MSLSQNELNAFHEFATEMLGNGGAGMSLEDLVSAWRDAREVETSHEGIRRGLKEVDAGQHRSLDEFFDEFRQQRNISPDA